jgi:hypothetical protein
MITRIYNLFWKACVFIFIAEILNGFLLSGGCAKRHPQNLIPKEASEVSQEDTQRVQSPTHRVQKPGQPKWNIVSHFGMITTVWIAQDSIKDKFFIAQILHQVDQKYRNNSVWFFDNKEHTPRGVPMTDDQMLHWVGLYDPAQSDTFSYVEVTDVTSSPPTIKTIKTSIRPGFAE